MLWMEIRKGKEIIGVLHLGRREIGTPVEISNEEE